METGEIVAGKYQFVEMLGESDLSRVFLADRGGQRFVVRHFRLGHDTALGEEIAASVAERATALYQLRRDGLPRITECLRFNGETYLVRDYVQEPTLVDVVRRGELPAERKVREWGRSLCDAFAVLHEQKPPFAFSGLKPTNIAVSRLGKIRILDYPVACFLPDSIQALYSARGYVPRELVHGEEPTVASDIYNLGQLLAYMLSGVEAETEPYGREALMARRPDLSSGLLDVLDRATAEEPSRRFVTVREMKVALGDGETSGRVPAAPVVAVEAPVLTLDPPAVRLTDIKQGARERITIVAQSSGPGVRVKVDSADPWIFVQRRAHHGARFQIVIVVDTTTFTPGVPARGEVVVEGDAGRYVIPIEITTVEERGALRRMMDFFKGR